MPRRAFLAGILLWPIAYLCATRVLLAPRFPATHALVGDWYNHAMYFGVFVLGFALAGTRGTWAMLQRTRWLSLALAILGWAFLCVYLGAYQDDAAIPPDALRWFSRFVYGAEQWLAIAAIVRFAHLHLKHDSAARRYLTTAIFPVYILHQTVIVVVAHALKSSNLYPPIEALLLVSVTVTGCFLGYEVIRRTRLLQPLFGLARDPIEPGQRRPRANQLPVAQRLTPEFSVPQDIN